MTASEPPPWGPRLRSAAPWLVASAVVIGLFTWIDTQGVLVEVARVAAYGWLGFEALSRLVGVRAAGTSESRGR